MSRDVTARWLLGVWLAGGVLVDAAAPADGAATLNYRTGLLTWLRADDLDGDGSVTNNPADGAAVSQWRDSNTSGNHAAQTNAVRQPAYRTTGGPNRMPMVAFDGTNDYLELPELSYSITGWTLFMVGRMPAVPTNTLTSVAFGDYGFAGFGGNQSFPALLLFRLTGSLTFTPFARDGNKHEIRADDTNGWSRYAIRSVWVNDKTVNYRVTDGTRSYAGAGAQAAAFNPITLYGYHFPTIGALPPYGLNNANLELSELLLFDRTLNDGQRAEVESYLKQKYYPSKRTYAAMVLSDTPLAYWRLNETSGIYAYDSSLNGKTATNSGGVTMGVAGIPGGGRGNTAYVYDGLDDETTRGGDASLAPAPSGFAAGQGWTVEAWVKVPAVMTGYTLVGWYLNVVDNSWDWYSLDVLSGSGAPRGFVRDHARAAGTVAGTRDLRGDGRWHHLALTFGRDADNAPFRKLYQDGELVGTDTTNALGVMTGTADLTLGWFHANPADVVHTTVVLDEVAIYGYALSPERIRTHYLAGSDAGAGCSILFR